MTGDVGYVGSVHYREDLMEEVARDTMDHQITTEEEAVVVVQHILLPHLVYCQHYLPTEQVYLLLPEEAVAVEVIGNQTYQTVVQVEARVVLQDQEEETVGDMVEVEVHHRQVETEEPQVAEVSLVELGPLELVAPVEEDRVTPLEEAVAVAGSVEEVVLVDTLQDLEVVAGGSGYIGGVTGGRMSNGQRSGNGYATITLVE